MVIDNLNRRALMLASGSMLAVAGCIGDGSSDGTDGDSDDDDGTADDGTGDADDGEGDDSAPADDQDDGDDEGEPDGEELAVEHIDEGRTALQAAFDEMEKRHEDDFDNEPFQDHLGTVRTELDTAEEHATASQLDEIDDLRVVTGYLEPWGNAEDTVERGFGPLEPGSEAYWAGRDYYFMDDPGASGFEDSATEFADAQDLFAEGQSRFENAAILFEESREELEDIEPSVLDDFENADHQAHFDHLEFAQYFSANMNFLTGGHAFGAQAWSMTSNAAASYIRDNFEEAKAGFESARDLFDECSGTYLFVDFQSLYDTMPFLEEMFGVLICENESGVEMCEHLIAGMDAAIDGDEDTEQEQINAGLETPADCH